VTARAVRATDVLTRDEIAALTRRSNLRGALAVGWAWIGIAGLLALLAAAPHPATFVLVVILLGGRQLALVVLMHEASHGTLFRSKWCNDVLVDAICARPVWTDVARYRRHHVGHHAHTGTPSDPDRSLTAPFPISRASLARKLLRDASGVSGLKRLYGLALMDAELLSYTVAADPARLPYRGAPHHARALARRAWGFGLAQLLLLGACAALGHAWVFSAWAVAFLTSYGVMLRVRSMSEHACTEGVGPLELTRTTRAGWLARLTVAPLDVNFHVEHHLLATVPYYRLREMHELLRGRGALPAASLAKSYAEVLAIVTRPRGGDRAAAGPA
jgi:fatty acid desaturase